ncbi:MAG: T9SS type A sorting domain-containing protein [Fibrobacteres bacterium]|nr:T9SS type A sorting domain-containing protein [Fibrobacterota bacterium]
MKLFLILFLALTTKTAVCVPLFSSVQHYINDSLGRDTIYSLNSGAVPSRATVTIKAIVGPAERDFANVYFLCDENKSISDDLRLLMTVHNFLFRNRLKYDGVSIINFRSENEIIKDTSSAALWSKFIDKYDCRDTTTGDQNALYYNIYKAVDYALKDNDKASAPVVILLSDGDEKDSHKAFIRENQLSLPRHFRNIPVDSPTVYLRNEFKTFMNDSIGSRVNFFSLLIDSQHAGTEYQTLKAISSPQFIYNTNLDTFYYNISGKLGCCKARPLPNRPTFTDVLDKSSGLKYISGSLRPNFNNQTIPDSIRIDSIDNNYLFRFYSPSVDPTQQFCYNYDIEFRNTSNDTGLLALNINNDSLLSRVKCVSFLGDTAVIPFPKDTLYIRLSPPSGAEDSNIANSCFALKQNSPNPFNPKTMITFAVPSNGLCELKLYDLSGRCVKNILNKYISAGSHSMDINLKDITPGTYIYRLKSGSKEISRRMTLLR